MILTLVDGISLKYPDKYTQLGDIAFGIIAGGIALSLGNLTTRNS